MGQFKDNTGREWQLDVEVDAIKRCRRLANIDLLEMINGRLAEKMLADPIMLVDCVFALVQPQAKTAGVSDEEFGRAMKGEAIADATAVLLEDLAAFSPSPHRRALFEKAMNKLKEIEKQVTAKAEKLIDGPELQQELNRKMDEIGGQLFTKPPESAV